MIRKYSDATLKGQTKEWLIEYIGILEHNLEVLEITNQYQFKILEQLGKSAERSKEWTVD